MYYFYIDYGDVPVLLPVTPSELSVKIKNQNKTINLLDGSEYNVIKVPGLSEISFDCLFPNVKYPFANYEDADFRYGQYYLDVLEKLKIECKPFYLRIVRKEDFGNSTFYCTIEDYTIKEKGKNGFDFDVSLKLKMYQKRKTNIVNILNNSNEAVVTQERSVDKTEETFNYTIVKGDTLWGIAKRYYGDGNKYTQLYNDNKDVIEAETKRYGKASSSNGWWIYPGCVIVIKNGIK